jgi:LuxR family maltose regulon positive regulatory protein
MTAELPRTPLLAMKHSVPPVRRRAAPRDRLMATLHDAGTRLTTVVAPAGWGKTSLLSAWAATAGEQRIAWVSLDDADDEPTRFWTYVFTALHASGDVSDAALTALAAPGVGPVDLALPILLNELAAVAVPHVLVLDDYHVLTDPVIHEGVEFLVTYLPATARIVLSGRRDRRCRWRGCASAATSPSCAPSTYDSPWPRPPRCSPASPARRSIARRSPRPVSGPRAGLPVCS